MTMFTTTNILDLTYVLKVSVLFWGFIISIFTIILITYIIILYLNEPELGIVKASFGKQSVSAWFQFLAKIDNWEFGTKHIFKKKLKIKKFSITIKKIDTNTNKKK